MKILVLSDLHIEFSPFTAVKTEADVVVLAGDIGTKLSGIRMASAQFEDTPTVYVAGNHEYYGGAIPHHTRKMSAAAAEANIHFLENASVVIDGVRFLGCTLWTDFKLHGADNAEFARWDAGDKMNDYRRIRSSPLFKKLKPYHTSAMHYESRHWLETELAKPFDGATVIVTHHAPHINSIRPHYHDDDLAPTYASDLEGWIEDKGISLWIHGHTHYCADYLLGNTRVVSNQRGYPGDNIVGYDPGRIFTVDSY